MALNYIRIPVIYHKRGSLKELKSLEGERILIVTDKAVWDLFGEKVVKYFKKREVTVYDAVEPDPKDTIVLRGADVAKQFKPDLIIGIGGGSVLDSAKVIYFLYERGDKTIYQIDPITNFKLGAKAKLVLVPTTSGTGAEMTAGAVVTNTSTGQKVTLLSFEIIPSMVILDPQLPSGMPDQLTASTGMDAVVHAIEGAISKIRNDFTDAMNLHAIRLLFEYLPKVLGEGASDIEVREKVHNAASIAGIGFGFSGVGIGHSTGHALGAVHHLQHGLAVGVMLPYVLEFNKPECEDRYKLILQTLNVRETDNPSETLVGLVKTLLQSVRLPTCLKELIPENDWTRHLAQLTDFAQKDILTAINPRVTSQDDLREIFQCAYHGKKVDW